MCVCVRNGYVASTQKHLRILNGGLRLRDKSSVSLVWSGQDLRTGIDTPLELLVFENVTSRLDTTDAAAA